MIAKVKVRKLILVFSVAPLIIKLGTLMLKLKKNVLNSSSEMFYVFRRLYEYDV